MSAIGGGSKELLAAVESVLLSPTPPSPSQRLHLFRSLRKFRPSFSSLLSYPAPKASDRAQVQQKEVRLPDSPPIKLDDQDVQIALKLSDELHLNEVECVRLLLHANQDWGLTGREPLEIYRLAAGLWYTERRDLITALFTLLRAVVLDQAVEADFIPEIQKYLEDLINDGLRQRLISLIKELNREEPAGFGGPMCEHYVLDSRGTLAERAAAVCRERLILGHCLVLSVLVVRISQKDAKDILYTLRDAASELAENDSTAKQQITYGLLFTLIIAFVSDALSSAPDRVAVLTNDSSFRNEFHEMVVATGNNRVLEAFVDGVRLAWAVHLMLIQDPITPNRLANLSSSDLQKLRSCVDIVFKNNVFQSLLDNVLKTAAYLNEDEDMIYMYHAYLHKLVTCLLTHPLARDKVKEAKEKAMGMFIPYRAVEYHSDRNSNPQQAISNPSFVSLLEFVSEIYEREPELLSGNDVLWTFVTFAGEDHTSIQTLVAFLRMLSTLASSEEGASKVYELLQGKAFRAVGWSTLFDCLSIYGEKLKQSLQTTGAMLPEFLEGDAKALVAYLNVLQKVMENGNPVERKNWFPNIEPLFKLLGYETVPPYLKGALRNTIATFVHVSPVLKDTIWSYLEQYDLPVVVSPNVAHLTQSISPVYDMQFELNEIEARNERYPSTISFVNLINTLITEERDASDRGHKFIGIFRFIYDHVFGPFPQRAYADPNEKWQLVTACLQHFHLILSMYDILDEDIDSVIEKSQTSVVAQPTSLQAQLPVLELLKDFMSGKTVFRNIMAILLPGVDSIISERSSQTYGHLLEKALQLCLDIIVLVLEKDSSVSEFWRPLYQPLDVILSQDPSQVTCLLEYVRYDLQQQVQLSSIKIMSILSSRMVGLAQLLLTSDTANSLTEDYAACLESRLEESQVIDSSSKDPGVLIMQVLIDNIGRPAPNISHILLKFDVDGPIDRTLLQPKFHYSCLKIILEALETLEKPDLNSLIHEFGFQLLYELCVDPLTSVPTMDLLANRRYQFFIQHLDTIGIAPLPKRMNNQTMRISSLHQRAWLLKLFALELHAADMGISSHREACQKILVYLFGLEVMDDGGNHVLYSSYALQGGSELVGAGAASKNKALELLEVVQFRSPDTSTKLSEVIPSAKFQLLAEDILSNPATFENGGIYYYSERGDRLIDLASFSDKLWQKMNVAQSQVINIGSEFGLNDVRESVQLLLRWAWKYDKNLEEQAAQLHMLTAWSQLVEVSASRRLSLLEDRSDILHQILDATLSASASPDCSVKMAFTLSQVALTCMAKLRDEKFAIPGALTSDGVTCLDIIVAKQLSNGACYSILIKLIMAILRRESSEALRRRQYALLLSYFQYCQHMLDPDIPTKVLESLLLLEEDSVDFDLQKINKEQLELARANFSLVRKEAQGVLDLVTKDATQGSEAGKTIAFYVLDALIGIDQDRYFLNQLQSRGFLRSCLVNISNFTFQDGGHSLFSMQRACTFEAELAFLLRISHKYGKSGAQVLFSMGALEHVSSCKVISLQGPLKQVELKHREYRTNDVDKDRMVVTPVLRLLFSLTSLVEASDIFEVKSKIAREIVDFVKRHEVLFDQVLRQDIYANSALVMEQINLVVGVLSKVWSYEEIDNHGFIQTLFSMMCDFFSHDFEGRRNLVFDSFRLCFGLVSYLYFLVTKKSVRLQVSQNLSGGSSARMFQPTLILLCSLLNSVSLSMERAAEEKSLLLIKIQNINELSRQEVDEVISGSNRVDSVSATDNLQKRRYIAILEMCQAAAKREKLLTLLLPLAEQLLNIILIHSQDSSILPDRKMSSRSITRGTECDLGQDGNHFCGEVIQVLERLELLSEDKTGHNLKVFLRLVTSIKEMMIKKLSL